MIHGEKSFDEEKSYKDNIDNIEDDDSNSKNSYKTNESINNKKKLILKNFLKK